MSDIVIDTEEPKVAPAKPEKTASAKIEPKAAKPKAKKEAKPKAKKAPKAPKEAKPKAKKEPAEGSTRKRFTIDLSGEPIGVKIDRAYEKKLAAHQKRYDFGTLFDAMNDLLKVAFGRLAALDRHRDKQEE